MGGDTNHKIKPWHAFVFLARFIGFGMETRETYHIHLSSITVIYQTKN
jgi:hypothetical protein